MVSNDRPTCKDRHAAELIMARREDLHSKAEYIAADLSPRPNFLLQSRGGPYIVGNGLTNHRPRPLYEFRHNLAKGTIKPMTRERIMLFIEG
jgi:hypothetical protein